MSHKTWCVFFFKWMPVWPFQIQTADGQLASVTRGMGDVVRGIRGVLCVVDPEQLTYEQPEMEKNTCELK